MGQFLNLATLSCQLSNFLLDQQHIHTPVINLQIYLQHGPAVQLQSTYCDLKDATGSMTTVYVLPLHTVSAVILGIFIQSASQCLSQNPILQSVLLPLNPIQAVTPPSKKLITLRDA